MARVSCGSCFYEFRVSSKHAGKRVRCPECGDPVRISSSPSTAAPGPAPPRRSSGSSAKRSKKKRKGSSGDNTMLLMAGGAVAVLLVGVAAFLLGRSSGSDPVEATSQNPYAAGQDADNPSTETAAQTSTGSASGESGEHAPASSAAAAVTPPASQTVAASDGEPAEHSSLVEDTPETTDVTTDTVATASVAVDPEEADEEPTGRRRPTEPMEMVELVEYVEQSVVRILVKGEYGASLGSGFVVGTDGAVVTNYHVIEGAKSAEVAFRDGSKASVTGVFETDHTRDIAVIKIDAPAEQMQPLFLAEELPQKGAKVAAFGAPQGLEFSASDGIISGFRKPEDIGLKYSSGQWLQTTAPISQGNSGGPLVNMRGEVVAMNSAVRTDGQNLNFAVSSVDIQDVFDSRGDSVAALSPESVPQKIGGTFSNAENLAGTSRGNLLLSQIREAVVVIAPLNADPTGRITDYIMTSAEKNVVERTGWKRVYRASRMKGSTAIVFVALYFDLAEGVAPSKLVSEMNVVFQIISRDVDEDGNELLAIVWDEKETVGTVSLKALAQGIVPRGMKNDVNAFFKKFVRSYRQAVRDVEG